MYSRMGCWEWLFGAALVGIYPGPPHPFWNTAPLDCETSDESNNTEETKRRGCDFQTAVGKRLFEM
jgi:hypothetical protein